MRETRGDEIFLTLFFPMGDQKGTLGRKGLLNVENHIICPIQNDPLINFINNNLNLILSYFIKLSSFVLSVKTSHCC